MAAIAAVAPKPTAGSSVPPYCDAEPRCTVQPKKQRCVPRDNSTSRSGEPDPSVSHASTTWQELVSGLPVAQPLGGAALCSGMLKSSRIRRSLSSDSTLPNRDA